MTAVVPERMRADRVRRKAVRHAVASWARFALMVVVTVVLLAVFFPSYRASRVSPIEALQDQ